MRLVFVNHAHPDILHVSGMRTGYFARELARRGHRVVLLTCALPDSKAADAQLPDLSTRLASHDWREPMIVAVPPIRRRALELIRENRLPAVARRALTLWQFVAFGGLFADWHKAAEDTIRQIAEGFGPELVWGTFGNTTNLTIASQLARRGRCSWVMDIKDSWTAFVPAALRRWMAWQFRDAVARTSNSRHHRDVAAPWLTSGQIEVIYSGVAEECFPRAESVHGEERGQLLLVGSTYDGSRLNAYLEGVRGWLERLGDSELERVSFVYVGADADRVSAALKGVPLPCTVQVLRYRPIRELMGLARQSFANSYLAASFTFHHKLLELLVCGRPLICYPNERPESQALASQTDTPYFTCESKAELCAALDAAWANRRDNIPIARVPAWRWSDFADDLERLFARCVGERQG